MRLNGKKFIFSNSPRDYCLRVLNSLKVKNFFDGYMTMELTKYNPKPSKVGFLKLIKEKKLSSKSCIMVDDDRANLFAAKQLRLKTILVSKDRKKLGYVDYVVKSVPEIVRLLN